MKKELRTGHKFLPNINNGRLRTWYKNEKDPKARQQLLACMARKCGESPRTIAERFCKAHSTIHDWLARAESRLDNLHDVKRPGPDTS